MSSPEEANPSSNALVGLVVWWTSRQVRAPGVTRRRCPSVNTSRQRMAPTLLRGRSPRFTPWATSRTPVLVTWITRRFWVAKPTWHPPAPGGLSKRECTSREFLRELDATVEDPTPAARNWFRDVDYTPPLSGQTDLIPTNTGEAFETGVHQPEQIARARRYGKKLHSNSEELVSTAAHV